MIDNLTGWIDYDREKLKTISKTDKIKYFEKRVCLVIISPINRLLNETNEVVGRSDSSALLIIAVSLCCAIEATGKFLNGSIGNNQDRFKEFLKKYMSPDFQSKFHDTMSYGDCLWKYFRNGIAHGFAVSHGGFEGNTGQPYFNIKNIDSYVCLMINPFELFNDFKNGFNNYLTNLREANDSDNILINFIKIFDKVFIEGR